MILIKNKSAISKMQEAGRLLSSIFDHVEQHIISGSTTFEIDQWIASELTRLGLKSNSLGYMGYRHVSCISVNDEVVHGIPSKKRLLCKGDLVKVDVCASWQGYAADMARSIFVEESQDASAQQMIEVAQLALNKGIEKAIPGNRLSDISAAIQQEVEAYNFGVVRDFAGHGIGKSMHEDPEILNYGKPGQGPVLRPGMTFALEPMITMGSYVVYVAEDGWTVKTKDKSLAAHVEDTIVITDGKPQVITRFHG